MKAVARKVLVKDTAGKFYWNEQPTKNGAPLDDLIETNIINYSEKLDLGMSDEFHVFTETSRQCEFNFLTSIPNFTAQPVAREISAMKAGATR